MSFFGAIGKAFASAFGFGASAPSPAPLTAPNGGDGVQAYGGFLLSDERHPALSGQQKWITYANAYNTAVIATGLRYRAGLIGGAKWHAEPNPRGGPDADRAVEIVEQGLINAAMPRPFNAVMRKASLFTFTGFSLHEWTIRRRKDDGMIVFAELAHRPQHTIDRWNKPSEQAPWDAVHQLTHAGNSYVIPRNRLFYCWDDLLTDMPDGMGLLRHVIELVRRLNVLEGLEGIGFETDLRGMPIGRAPIKALMAEAETKFGNDAAKVQAYVAEKTANLRQALQNIVKSPDKLQYLLLDSGTYVSGVTQADVSSVQRWALDLLNGSPTGLGEINTAINRLQLEIARVLGIEFALMGGGSGGSRAMHTDKTSMLAQSIQTTLTEMSAFATNDLCRPLIALNGLDPDTCTPTLVAEPIATDDISVVAAALQALASAGLAPNDPAWAILRDRMSLPPPPEPTPEMMGMMPPDPSEGEVDVPVDDLETDDPTVTKQDDPTELRSAMRSWVARTSGKQIAKFDIDQPRAPDGKWSGGGGSSSADSSGATAASPSGPPLSIKERAERAAAMRERSRRLADAVMASDEANKATDEASAAYGTAGERAAHARAAELHTKAGDMHTELGDGFTASDHYEMASRHG